MSELHTLPALEASFSLPILPVLRGLQAALSADQTLSEQVTVVVYKYFSISRRVSGLPKAPKWPYKQLLRQADAFFSGDVLKTAPPLDMQNWSLGRKRSDFRSVTFTTFSWFFIKAMRGHPWLGASKVKAPRQQRRWHCGHTWSRAGAATRTPRARQFGLEPQEVGCPWETAGEESHGAGS